MTDSCQRGCCASAYATVNYLLEEAFFATQPRNLGALIPQAIHPLVGEVNVRQIAADWPTARRRQIKILQQLLPLAKDWNKSEPSQLSQSVLKLTQAALKELEQIDSYEMLVARNEKGQRKVHHRWAESAFEWLDRQTRPA